MKIGKIWKMAFVAIFLFNGRLAMAQDIQAVRDAFYANRFSEARQKAEVLASGKTKENAEAHLLLSFIDGMEGKSESAFNRFMGFFKEAENPYPFVFSLWSSTSVMGSDQKKTSARFAFLNQLTSDPKANGTLKAMAWASLGDHYTATNQMVKAAECYDKIGTVSQWAVTGEFENISESGFDKKYKPIAQPEDSARFINRNGAEVRWFPLPGNRADKWVDFTFHFFAENSILFAQSFVKSPVDQDVQFRLGTSGSLKLWVNDDLRLTESEERNNDLDTYLVPIHLNAGYNRVLLQIGASEIDRSNFMLRITDSDGNPIPGITAVPTKQPYATASNKAMPERIPVFAEAFFENTIRENKGNVLDYLVLAHAYLRNDKGYEARKILAEAEKKIPASSFLKIQQIEAFNRSDNSTDAKIAIDWIKQHDPDNLFSLNLLLSESLESEKLEESRKTLEKIVRLYGESESVLLQQIGIAGKEGKQDEVISLINKGYEKYPDNYLFVKLKSETETAISKSTTEALKIIRKYLKTNYSYDAQKALSDLLFSRGKNEEGLDAYNMVLQNSPYAPGFHYNLGNYFFGKQDYASAEKSYRKCLAISPFIHYFWSALAKVKEANHENAEAITYFQKSLSLNPVDGESREKLRRLQGKKEIYSHFPEIKVDSLMASAPPASAFPDEHSVILLDEVQKVIYKGGASEEKRFMIAKILSDEGINRWKQYSVEHYANQTFDIEKAEVIKSNGSRVEAEVSYDEMVFTNLEVGDAIHVVYKLSGMNAGLLHSHFWDSFYFSHFIPYQTARYRLLIEKGLDFQYKFSKEPIQPLIETKEDFSLYTWEKKNQPALGFEERMPELADVGNVLSISSIRDWSVISDWYYDLAANKAKVNLEVKEAVAKVLAGKQNLPEMEKARLIYEYIVTHIKYLSVAFMQSGLIPQKAAHVLNTKLGDCKDVSTLFVAMCAEAGLKADLVLIATRNGGKHQMILPTIDFNHCIARLISGGREYYIELTSDKLPFNTFYNNLLNATALNIKAAGTGAPAQLFHLNPPSRNLNLVVRETVMEAKNLNLSISKKTIKTGVYASNMRESYLDLSSQDRLKEMQRAIAGDYNQTILKNLKFNGLKGISDTVEYTYDYQAPEAINEIGGLQLMNLPWSERTKSTDFNFTENRQLPIDLWELEGDGEQETITFAMPPKTQLAELPKNINISCPVGEYSLQYSQKPGKLLITRKMRYKKDRVDVPEMKEFEEFYRKMVAGDNRQLALKKMPGPR